MSSYFGLRLLVFTNEQHGIGQIHVWRDFKIVWRRLVGKYAPGNVKG
jgi:hypothetical protein